MAEEPADAAPGPDEAHCGSCGAVILEAAAMCPECGEAREDPGASQGLAPDEIAGYSQIEVGGALIAVSGLLVLVGGLPSTGLVILPIGLLAVWREQYVGWTIGLGTLAIGFALMLGILQMPALLGGLVGVFGLFMCWDGEAQQAT